MIGNKENITPSKILQRRISADILQTVIEAIPVINRDIIHAICGLTILEIRA
jgi:hypothetical protein